MFVISPINDKEEQRALCARMGAEYHPGDMAYRVTIEGKEAGIVSFFIKGKTGNLRSIDFLPESRDFEVMFIAGRTCMEFMDRVGANEGYYLSPDPENERLTKALGYRRLPDGRWFLDTTGFFVDHCGSAAKNEERK
ncbi:MAG: hypothetical protein IJU52_07095 [Clostridia bacterium]|nr:hypothetical protein [Clostridia bacterium]